MVETESIPPTLQVFRYKESNQLNAQQEEILRLKEEKNAILLCHNYQVDPIQQVADYVGDSLGLARQAAETDAEVIVFCGVHFMAETAKILNPGKTVLLPDLDAGCSLSDSCPAEQLANYKEKNPELYVVAYVNCSAGVKALSDVICTSGNAVKIVEQVPKDREILFVPDQNLGQWVIGQTGRNMQLWPEVAMPMFCLQRNPLSVAGWNTRRHQSLPIQSASIQYGKWRMKYAVLKKWCRFAKVILPILLSF